MFLFCLLPALALEKRPQHCDRLFNANERNQVVLCSLKLYSFHEQRQSFR